MSLLTPSLDVISLSSDSITPSSELSEPVAFLLWNGLATSTQSHSTTLCVDFVKFASDILQLSNPFPAFTDTLIEWVGQLHNTSKPYQTVKRNLAILKSWHIDPGQPTTAFDAAHLA
ncbi:hypothetical protein NDA13_005320 [Ustilago tritici]|nr:hypothetical protein NDA13_005320 [Ustilago tritici]